MPVSGKHIIWLLPLLGLSVMAGQFVVLHYIYYVDLNIALADSAITVVTLALAIWGVIQSIRLYPTPVGSILYSLLVALFFSFSATYFSTLFIKWWINYDPGYTALLDRYVPVRYIIFWLLCSWEATYSALSRNLESQEKKFKQYTDTATLLKEAELFKLRQQLQPHFLYNSLNSISALTITEPEKAQEMIGLLSDFLRNSVKRDGKEKISLQEELDYLDNYLAIEAIRFGDRLNVQIDNRVEDGAIVPPFLLQPLLENAIKFGVYGNTGKVTITVSIFRQGNLLNITITNPFDAGSQPPGGTGFGLKGVGRRLYLLYARNDLLDTRKDEQEHTFITTIKIPQDV